MDLACLDGAVVPVDEARIPATDDGLLRGDGVFEVVRLYGGRPYALDEHLARMEGSAAGLRLPLSVEAVAADVRALLDAARPGEALLRMVVTRGGHRLALLEPLPDQPPTLALGPVEYAPTRVLDGIKSLSYAANVLARRLAQERGFDEALFVTPHGRILEGPTSTFVAVLDGQLVTPPLGEHILDSITRRRVRECNQVAEAPITVDDLGRAEGAFLASTVREVHPVHRIEQRELDPSHPMVREAEERTSERIRADLAASAPA
jgi:branched-subunit amino acid aminotransferase/4-amino-4-deoxychorismate lyase